MKYLNGQYYVEVKDHRYKIQPTGDKIVRLRNPPKSLRTQYQVQNDTHIRKNQKVIKNDNDELEVENNPRKKQPNIQQTNFKPSSCPSRKRKNWLDFLKGYYCHNCQ